MLEVRDIETGYGRKPVLFGVSLNVAPSEIVALIGPNGAGKSTLLRAICGVLPAWKGNVLLGGVSMVGATPAQAVSLGITFAPQGSRVFDELTVQDNLEIGGHQLRKRDLRRRVDAVLDVLPALREHRQELAGRLSGGEQQMLALARALVPQPKVLLLDEPSLGLSPRLVELTFQHVMAINRDTGVAILVVEQKVREVLSIAHRVYGLKLGHVVIEAKPVELTDDELKGLFL